MKIAFLISVLFFGSCASKYEKLVIIFENGEGLAVNNPVMIQDIEAGIIKKISLTESLKVRIEIQLNSGIKIPNDSEFYISTKDVFTKSIAVEPGTSKTFFTSSDDIKGRNTESGGLELFFDALSDRLNNSKVVRNQDSIRAELKKLNQLLDK